MYVYHYTLMQSFLQKSMCLKPSTNTHHRSFINKKEVIRKYSFSVKTIKCGREILILHSRFTASISSDTKHGPSSRMSIEIIVIFLFSPATQKYIQVHHIHCHRPHPSSLLNIPAFFCCLTTPRSPRCNSAASFPASLLNICRLSRHHIVHVSTGFFQ